MLGGAWRYMEVHIDVDGGAWRCMEVHGGAFFIKSCRSRCRSSRCKEVERGAGAGAGAWWCLCKEVQEHVQVQQVQRGGKW